ncbi:aminotransferase class III-fold pyridoxal phosphate-dependent enzyme [Candidatus Margulisiibacteriota bacterium]
MNNTITKNANTILKDNLDYTLFSWSKQAGLDPLNIEKADGIYLFDRNGKKHIDFSSQLMNVNIGHNNKKVNAAIIKQLNEVAYVCPKMVTEARGALGKKIAQISPGNLGKTFFTTGGADAIENAIKLARIYTGKHKIITKYRSYHGATYGAISAGGDPRKLKVDRDALSSVVHVEDPYCYRCPWSQNPDNCHKECVSHVERIIQFEGPENIAAILMEGESGSSGCIKYPQGYWKKIKELADKYNILIIVDEVMSGFGRCGQWFAIQSSGVEPDMIAMAKGLTSGYIPLGGLVVSNKIAAHFDNIPLMLGLTYSAHPVACAAGLACIEVYEQENLLENAINMGEYLEAEMIFLKEKHPSIGDFRNTGLLGCIELVKNKKTKEPITPWNAKAEEMEITNKVAAKLRELGLFTFVRWNWIFLAPPLIITREQMDEALAIISKAVSVADQYYSE